MLITPTFDIKITNMTKKLPLFALLFFVVGAKAQLLLVDNFKNYSTSGPTNGNLSGQNGWISSYDNFDFGTGDAPPVSSIVNRGKIISQSLTMPGFITTDKVLQIASTNDGIGKGFTTMSPTSGTVYVALPFSINSFNRFVGPSTTDSNSITGEANILRVVYKLAAGDFPTTACRFFVKPVSGGYNIGVSKATNSSTYKASPTLLSRFQNVLVVLKYTFNPGTNDDQVSLYINPNLSLPENMNTPEVQVVGNGDASIIQGVNLNFNTANCPNTFIGGVYASTTWPSIQNALPINCISNLQLIKTNTDKAKLVWDATNCKEIKEFTIQTGLQTSGLDNTTIVNSKGDGNYSSEISLKQGTNFVRLVTTDLNGQKLYSQILSVKNGGIIKNLELYPNPTKNQLNITLNANASQVATLQVFNLQGKLVYQHQRHLQVGQNVLAIDVANLPAGLYSFKALLSQNQFETKTFIKK